MQTNTSRLPFNHPHLFQSPIHTKVKLNSYRTVAHPEQNEIQTDNTMVTKPSLHHMIRTINIVGEQLATSCPRRSDSNGMLLETVQLCMSLILRSITKQKNKIYIANKNKCL